MSSEGANQITLIKLIEDAHNIFWLDCLLFAQDTYLVYSYFKKQQQQQQHVYVPGLYISLSIILIKQNYRCVTDVYRFNFEFRKSAPSTSNGAAQQSVCAPEAEFIRSPKLCRVTLNDGTPCEPPAMLLSDASWRICLFNRRRQCEADMSHLHGEGNFYVW